MDTVRGLTVWLGAPLLASFVCTAALQVISGGPLADWRSIGGFAEMTLIFTVGGSAMLSLAFAAMEERGLVVIARYGALVGLGALAGGAMLFFGGPGSVLVGACYGAVTASFWVGLHRVVYGSR